MEYDGITADTLFLVAKNQFEDSKIFYDEHKEEIKNGFTVPMRQIAAALSEQMLEVDDVMVTDPVRMVSRIRRDNRYTKDKHMYRDHLWTMFMRNKHQWINYPCMWFEVNQDSWGFGVGMYYIDATYLELYRKALIERPQEFLEAVESAEKAGCEYSASFYKKHKPGNPIPQIEPYYDIKYMSFINRRTDFETLETDKVIKILSKEYKKLAPMYQFLKSVSDERTKL